MPESSDGRRTLRSDDGRRTLRSDGGSSTEESAQLHAVATPRVVLLATALGLVAVLGVGGVIAISTGASLRAPRGDVQAGSGEPPAAGDGSSSRQLRSQDSDSTSGSHASAGAAAADTASPEPGDAADDAGSLEQSQDDRPDSAAAMVAVYDAASDLDDVPRPPASWPDAAAADAERWLAQQGVIADCMHEKGFDYEFLPYWLGGAEDGRPPGVAVRDDRAWVRALDGDASLGRGGGQDSDWRGRGCRGYAEHVVG